MIDFIFPSMYFQFTRCYIFWVLSSELSERSENLGHEKLKKIKLKIIDITK